MSSRSASSARGRAGTAPAARSAAGARAPRPAGAKRAPRASAAERRRLAVRRRRLRGAGLLALVVAACAGLAVASGVFDTAVRQITLPLRHEDIIRQQAADKGLDAALIAGVIYTESHFRDAQVSSAGAQGLMQITPATASDIARKSGGVLFETEDLHEPQVNIAYGAYYLRYLMNRFGGDEALALAAYNGGEGNVDRWVAAARQRGERFRVARIPFTETREYVGRVRAAARQYRENYARELGL
jgi:soluble lytic murein transglycosylase